MASHLTTPLFLLIHQHLLTSLFPSQAYNSVFNSDPTLSPPLIGNFPLLPLRTKTRGPAYTLPLDSSLPLHLSPEPDSESYDALDEVLALYRANTFFRNFEIQGPPDRLLIYGILWVGEILGKIKPTYSARWVRDGFFIFLDWEGGREVGDWEFGIIGGKKEGGRESKDRY